jgi:RNase P subunit RPR2
MKINVNFTELFNAIKKMGAQDIEFNLKNINIDGHLDIDTILGTTGQEIKLEDLEFSDGLLSYHGRQVLLYIPDHGKRIEKAIDNPSTGSRFHVADCRTLNDMKRKKRFDRYIVTNKLSGSFDVSGISYETNKEIKDSIELKVCKNCLNFLNYQNYQNSIQPTKTTIFSKFTIGTFFENYSTLFTILPKKLNQIYSSTYTNDWKDISQKYRESRKFICEKCDTLFVDNKELLHTHHINGVKDDNSNNNLKAVCIDCHRKEPNHTHVMLNHENLSKIYKLRRIQNKSIIKTWDDVFKLADISLHGYLNLLKKKKENLLPEVGYIINDDYEEILFDLAWPKSKIAIVIKVSDANRKIPGWTIYTLGKVLSEINS